MTKLLKDLPKGVSKDTLEAIAETMKTVWGRCQEMEDGTLRLVIGGLDPSVKWTPLTARGTERKFRGYKTVVEYAKEVGLHELIIEIDQPELDKLRDGRKRKTSD